MLVDRLYNKVSSPPLQLRPEISELHRELLVVDLHADSLLWERDLLKRHGYGHVDVPRLIEGNVALQVMGVATGMPMGANWERNTAGMDMLAMLAVIQAWPPRTWGSPLQRALYQAEKLHRCAARSQGRLTLLKSVRELDEFLARRRKDPNLVGALLALEGAHALEGKLANLDVLYEAGFRMLGLAHFIDNEAAGSTHGVQQGGLTPFGRELLWHVQEKGMALDLAHASPQAIDDVFKTTRVPVLASHTGVRGVCDNPRNLADEHIRQIAASGGCIGIAMFKMAVGGDALDGIGRTMRYVSDLVGANYIAIGSDFDGTITAPIDSSRMALLTQTLVDRGFTGKEIAGIMGGNALRVLRAVLAEK